MPRGIYTHKKHSEATKELLRRINTGSGNPHFGKPTSQKQKDIASRNSKGNKYALGYKFTKEQSESLSLSRMGIRPNTETKKLFSGPNHYRWVADRTKLKTDRTQSYDSRYKVWMFDVKRRDGWKCKISNGDCAGRVEAHHILSWRDYEELRYNINNGITLCHFHHPRKRTDEIKLSPYFQSMVMDNSN